MALDGLDGNLARATGKVTGWKLLESHTRQVLDVVWILALGYNILVGTSNWADNGNADGVSALT